jgi:two-component system nitrogen regulation sensor histidine kinase GlnL
VTVEIIDNGPGIPEHIREKIFFPLISGRESGTGLGLSIAQDYIHQHGGTIEVDSEAGRTCFTIVLPLDARAAQESAPAPGRPARLPASA